MKIRHLKVENFRGIRTLSWQPLEGINCLIGSGDSCKSTILDAIDFVLGARKQAHFSDADFHRCNVEEPICIEVTLGQLPAELLNLETYGYFHRGFNAVTGAFAPEPSAELETVLTVRLTVGSDLDPFWGLFSERAEAEGRERNLLWKHRQSVAPVRLGTDAKPHMAWGARSVLNKLSEDIALAASALAAAARQARDAFAEEGCEGVDDVIDTSKKVANRLGIPVKEIHALLDMKGASFSGGAIALHDEKHVPLRALGTGSSRLLVSGLQREVCASPITIIDEVEFGLEPYRIVRLLDALGSNDLQGQLQVFMTSHSPFVLRELAAKQLHVVRCQDTVQPQPLDDQGNAAPPITVTTNTVTALGDGVDEQKLLRTNAEAFLAPNVVVCEGKTEIGLLKGMDAYFTANGYRSIVSHGVFWADGNGDPQLYPRAQIFARLGYRTCVFMDADKELPPAQATELQAAHIELIRWPEGNSTEQALINNMPSNLIPAMLNIAADWKSEQALDSQLKRASGGTVSFEACRDGFTEEMRPMLVAAASNGSWFKDITVAARLGQEVIAPHWRNFGQEIADRFVSLWRWAITAPSALPARIEEEQ